MDESVFKESVAKSFQVHNLKIESSRCVTILKSFKAVQVSRFQLFDIVTIFSKDFRIKPQLSQ